MGAIIKRGTKDKPRFYLQYTDADGSRRMKAAKGVTTKDQARQLLNAIELRISQGQVGIEPPKEPDPAEVKRRTMTVAELGEAFTSQYTRPKIKDIEAYRDDAKSILTARVYPTMGKRAAAEITSTDVERLRDLLVAPPHDLSHASSTHALAKISTMYRWGRKRGLIDCDNPAAGVERYKGAASVDYLSRDEVIKLLAHVETWRPDLLHPMVATAVYCGLRKGELFGLRWTDVHLDDGLRLDVMRSYDKVPKSGKPRTVPINAELARILRLWKERAHKNTANLVFAVNDGMGRHDKTLGLEKLFPGAECHLPEDGHVWHMLRHTFASHYMMRGGSILDLQKLLGHADIKETMRYAHLSPEHLATGIARMSFAAPIPAEVADLEAARRRRALELLEREPAAAEKLLALYTNQQQTENAAATA